MKFLEYLSYIIIKSFGVIIRLFSDRVAVAIGRGIGLLVYYFDVKHRSLSYGNLKIAFAKTKTPNALKKINQRLFRNFGQNLMELLRLPLLNSSNFSKYVKVEGKEHLENSLKKGKGVILLAMHFGSWELASLSCAMFGSPYKVIVKPQKKFLKLDDLLNSYRSCGGNVVLSRGLGTRELVKSLKNNEIIGMVVDQGGKDGVLVPFFGRHASMSVGAMRIGLKFDVPVCFTIVIRGKGTTHRMIIHEPLKLINTGDTDQDILTNLGQVTKLMEGYINKYPSEYMWFYKIWKYAKESNILILSDSKTGHLRQSQAVAGKISAALAERDIKAQISTIEVKFKNDFSQKFISIFSAVINTFMYQGRLEFLKWFLTKKSYNELMAVKAEFIVSCGSSISGINYLLANDQRAKSVAILKPGLLSKSRFDLVFLPQHDVDTKKLKNKRIVITKGAPNLINQEYLESQVRLLISRYSHLKYHHKLKIGLLIGGNTKHYILNEKEMKVIINQIKEVIPQINADIFVTTSRRTSTKIENLLVRELRHYANCPLLIIANQNNVPEAFGGIVGLSDILVVSGDSISMISEASSSGKKTVVFPVQQREHILSSSKKHQKFIEGLNNQGYIVTANSKNIGRTIYDLAKNKIHTQKLDDNTTIFEAVRDII